MIYTAPTASIGFVIMRNPPIADTYNRIIKDVCECFDVPADKVKAKGRSGHTLVLARQLCMALIKNYTPLSLKEIGAIFNNRDHTTVIHSKQAIADILSLEYSEDKDLILNFFEQYGYTLQKEDT